MMRDMMPGFELYQPATLGDALELLARHGESAWVLGGGQDSLDWFKDRVKRPQAVVSLHDIAELRGIREVSGGLEIGAMTTLTDLETDERIRERYRVLADAARKVASPQIRNVATLGGNIAQDTRCWYYRDGWPCYRAGGNTCYAGSPTSMNREHAIFGASRCLAVSPSDTGVALVALDAEVVIAGPRGERTMPAEQFFVGPSIDILRMTALRTGEIVTAVRLPAQWAGARFYFEKVADREAWDFALVSIAASLVMDGERVERIRLVGGAVECVPRRLHAAEDSVAGEVLDEARIGAAARAAARGARPLNHNEFKVPLMSNLVQRALRGA